MQISALQISKAELEVMQVLWATPKKGAIEVFEALETQKDWNIRTVKTLLARLVDKGALATSPEGRRFLYTPLISQSEYQAGATTQFVDRVFSGRAAPLVAHLADSRGLSPEDVDELEHLLSQLKKGKPAQ